MNRLNKVAANFSALLLGCTFALFLSEALLKLYFRKNTEFCMHEPNIALEIKLPPGFIRGGQGRFRYSTNQQGMRGENYPESDWAYRLLAMGGSTTLCAVLDDSQTWPALVQNRLQRTAQGQSIWIGNIGKNGLATRNHVLQLRYLLPQHSVDAVLLLVGINDLMLGLAESDDDVSQIVQRDKNRLQLMHQTFDVVPDSLIQPFYKRFVIWKLARQTKSYLKNHFDRSDEFAGLKIWRDYRRNGREVAIGPDLTAALEEYARNLTEIITLTKQQNIRLIMMTQPTLWHENMTPEEQEALCFGFVGDPRKLADHPHYSTAVLAQGMKSYNQKLLQLCRQYKVEYIDLAALVPRNLQVMYDECHFTVMGAQLVAGIIVDYLRARPPFAIGEQRKRQNSIFRTVRWQTFFSRTVFFCASIPSNGE